MYKKKCLVLGGTGFIGSHIAQTLTDNNYKVIIFDISEARLDPHILNRVEFIQGDFFNFPDWSNVLKGVDYVFHNISTTIPRTSDDDPVFDADTNITGNLRFLIQLKDSNIKKIVFSSSGGAIYGLPEKLPISEMHPTNPITSYGISKLAVEKYLHYFHYHHGTDFVSLRQSNVYGKGQDPKSMLGVVTVFLDCLKNNKTATVFGDGSIVRDYLYIDDAIRASLYAIEKETRHQIFNVGTGVGTSINELIKLIFEVTGRKFEVNYIGRNRSDVQANVLDYSLIRKELSWSPQVSLREGIERLWTDMLR